MALDGCASGVGAMLLVTHRGGQGSAGAPGRACRRIVLPGAGGPPPFDRGAAADEEGSMGEAGW